MKDFIVLRAHLGDKDYAVGDTRKANPIDVKHLIGKCLKFKNQKDAAAFAAFGGKVTQAAQPKPARKKAAKKASAKKASTKKATKKKAATKKGKAKPA